MGINGKHTLTHSLDNLSFVDVCAIVRRLKEQNDPTNQRRITVDVDASWLVRMKSKMSDNDRVPYLIRFCKIWSDAGFEVFLVCDAESRHHSKRIRYQRFGDGSRNKLRIRQNRRRLHDLAKESASLTITVEEKSRLMQEFVTLNDEQKRLERTIEDIFDVGDLFYNTKIQKLNRETSANGTINVLQAEFQADSLLAYRLNHGLSDIMICADSDQAALCGNRCFAIKQFKFIEGNKNRSSSVNNISIFTTSWNNIERIKCYLPNDSKYITKKSNTPVFENRLEPHVRALIAVGLGCDVFPKGVPNLGPAKMNKLLNDCLTDERLVVASYYDVLKYRLSHLYLEEVKANTEKEKQYETEEQQDQHIESQEEQVLTYYHVDEMFAVFVESFLYEPANFVTPNMLPQSKTLYIHDNVPSTLHPYNIKFARNTIGIEPSDYTNQMFTCAGPCAGHSHPFLLSEGVTVCSNKECKLNICPSCIFEHDGQKYCYNCSTIILCLGPFEAQIVDSTKSVSDMLLALQEIGLPMNAREDDILDIEDAFDTLVVNGRRFHSSIKFPLQQAAYLTQAMNKVSDFSFSDGGNIIFRDEHNIETIVSLLDLMESLLVSTEQDKDTYASDVLPTIISKFAEGSRDHGTGHRLKQRCLRHGMDTRTPELAYASGSVITYNGKTGLYIKHRIQASMKQDVYECEVAFTKEAIIANTCTCMCGCLAQDKVLCVHILPIIYQVHMLLCDGLALHILYEMSAFNKNTNVFKEYINRSIFEDSSSSNVDLASIVRQLEMACLKYTPNEDCLSMDNLLLKYDVGTEKVKFVPIIQEKDKEFMGPLRNLDLSSLTTRAKRRRQQVCQHQEQETDLPSNILLADNTGNEEVLFTATCPISQAVYQDMIRYGNAFLQCLQLPNNTIDYNLDDSKSIDRMKVTAGYKLLEHRSQEKLNDKCRLPAKYKDRIVMLIEKANSTKRSVKERNLNFNTSQHPEGSLLPNATEQGVVLLTGLQPSPDRTSPSSPDEANVTSEVDAASSEDDCSTVQHLKRRYCCVKGCQTSYMDDNVKFYKVPLTKLQIKLTSSDEVRKQFHSSLFRRKIYLQRFGKSYVGNETKRLDYCHKHELEIEEFILPWYDRKGKKKFSTEHLVVPKKNNLIEMIEQQRQLELTATPTEQPPFQDITNSIRSNANNNKNRLSHHQNSNGQNPSSTHLGKRCDYIGCSNRSDSTKGILLQRVPPLPTKKPFGSTFSRLDGTILKRNVQTEFRRETLKRMRLNPEHEQEVRICNQHSMETIEKVVEWSNGREILCKTRVEMNVPCRNSCAQQPSLSRQGLSQQQVNLVASATNKLDIATILCNLAGIQQGEVQQLDKKYQNCIQIAANNILTVANTVRKHAPEKLWYRYDINDSKPIVQDSINLENENGARYKKPNTMMSTEVVIKLDDPKVNNTVQKLTPFRSVHHMLVTLCTFCTNKNDDLHTIEKTVSRLTSFEEWLVFFTIIKGTLSWSLAEAYFKASEGTLRKIYDHKMRIVKDARDHWPKYATLKEDEDLRKEKWHEIFENERVVMWDNTNIKMYVPSDACNQRITYSRYYAGNVGKGAVYIQLCGWMGTHDIWCGGVSDTEYFIKSGIIQQQNKFVDENNIETKDIPWTNVLDRGYRVSHSCWKEGRQRVLQPSFAKNQHKFSGRDTIHTSQVASDRSGNERAVNAAKRSGYINRGLVEGESLARLCDAWLVWSFICNFVYLPVH